MKTGRVHLSAVVWTVLLAVVLLGTAGGTARCTFGDLIGGTPVSLQVGEEKVYLPTVTAGYPVGPRINLIANGTFEEGSTEGWEGDGVTASTAEAHAGEWSARVEDADMATTIDTVPGEDYKVTGWVKIVHEEGTDWGGFRVQVLT